MDKKHIKFLSQVLMINKTGRQALSSIYSRIANVRRASISPAFAHNVSYNYNAIV